MDAREVGRFVGHASDQAARDTAAIRRGHVDSIRADDRPIILLSNGAKILGRKSQLFDVSENQAVTMTQNGNRLEILAPSAFGGGLGAPFTTP